MPRRYTYSNLTLCFGGEAFLLSLLDAAARVGWLRSLAGTVPAGGPPRPPRSVFVGYSATVRDGQPDLQLGLPGGALPRLGCSLDVGYSAALELLFALHLNLLLLLDRAGPPRKEGARPDPDSASDTDGELPLGHELCICGLPIGDWSFVGTGTGTGGATGGPRRSRR